MPTDILILLTIVLLAASLQASTGYGFSMIGTPILMIVYPPHTAIQINIILSIVLSALMIYKIRNEVDTKLLKRLIIGSFPGIVVGIFVYLYLNIDWLKFSVGLIILLATVLIIFKVKINRSIGKDFTSGGISGALTTSIGVPGPPLLLYFSGSQMGAKTLRSTTLAYYLFIYTISLCMQVAFGGTEIAIWLDSLYALPALIVGVFVGQFLFKRMKQRLFFIITYIILIGSGLYLMLF
ncbi:MAG TPA: sulfite exporter TauE/SafE family protein [Aliicoccus persicus]|uniref:Probable membrane transporter protein n=1 Tax=Aliicoccus persicus TaxID=930138 RepID=A0A921JB43_9STAP|nr:sulfite exporter TauE/SafE family protein [Aliicoccus persicus]